VTGFYFGIDAQGSASLTVEENTINKGEYSIAFLDNSNGTVQNNVINDSVAGIFAKGSSNVTIRNNTITGDGIFENKAENSQGITFIDSSMGTALNNQISGYYYGFLINSLLTVQLQENTITTCKYGMRFDEFAVNTTASGNKISQCETGIWVNNNSAPILESNEIFSNTNAFKIETTSNPVLKNNNVHDNTNNE
jgi:parallel beta-helix repeat protein